MPSAKPDKDEVKLLRWKRGLSEPSHNLFSELFFQCRSALDGGYITPDRAAHLLKFLDSNDKVASIFPNNLLRLLLSDALKHDPWSLDAESVLLDFIAQLYLGSPIERHVPVSFTIGIDPDGSVTTHEITMDDNPELVSPPHDAEYYLAGLLESPNPLFAGMYELIYDPLPERLTIKDRFVAFTGAFNGCTRKICFDTVRKLGGVPTEPDKFLDILFVSNESYEKRAISNQLSSAIYCRRLYRNPLILRETDWVTVVPTRNGVNGST
jgi:hypothetical protein